MIRTILSLAVFVTLATAIPLKAEPAPNKKVKKRPITSSRTNTNSKVVPATPLTEGWSLVNGTWIHSDGYKFVKGQVIRTGSQTHKRPPKPPTQVEMQAATKKKKGPPTAAEIAAEKAAERERNLTPRPAPQTGTHL
jgi:hypothetical protein